LNRKKKATDMASVFMQDCLHVDRIGCAQHVDADARANACLPAPLLPAHAGDEVGNDLAFLVSHAASCLHDAARQGALGR
jgi:hypothetical protein